MIKCFYYIIDKNETKFILNWLKVRNIKVSDIAYELNVNQSYIYNQFLL